MVLFTSFSAKSVTRSSKSRRWTSLIAGSRRVAGLWLLQWQTATKPPGSARYTGRLASTLRRRTWHKNPRAFPVLRVDGRLRGSCGLEGIFCVTELSALVALGDSEPTSWKAIQRIESAVRTLAEMLGLPQCKVRLSTSSWTIQVPVA
jgi:hypothetical protein